MYESDLYVNKLCNIMYSAAYLLKGTYKQRRLWT